MGLLVTCISGDIQQKILYQLTVAAAPPRLAAAAIKVLVLIIFAGTETKFYKLLLYCKVGKKVDSRLKSGTWKGRSLP